MNGSCRNSSCCKRIEISRTDNTPVGLTVAPPRADSGDESLYRVVYVIDVNAPSPDDAARKTYGIMSDPSSQPPVLEVIDHVGNATKVDLSEEDEGARHAC